MPSPAAGAIPPAEGGPRNRRLTGATRIQTGLSLNPIAAMRLNRYLATCGLGSRRGCEKLILEGRVTIDGTLCTDLARRIREGERVRVDGRSAQPAQPITIALFKPRGLVTTRDDELGRATIYETLPEHLSDLRHAGRLDLESEGLLILTRDGQLAQRLTRPADGIEKEYLITLDRSFDPRDGDQLITGIPLEEGLAVAASYLHLSPRRLQLVLKQGMKRQLRRMFEHLGYRVKKLVRVRIGSLTIGKLTPGRWRPLENQEINLLLRNPVSGPGGPDNKRGRRQPPGNRKPTRSGDNSPAPRRHGTGSFERSPQARKD